MTTMGRVSRVWCVVGVLGAAAPDGRALAAPLRGAIQAEQAAPGPRERARTEQREAERDAAAQARRERQEREVEERVRVRERAHALAQRHKETGPWVDAPDGPIMKTFTGGEGVTLELVSTNGDIVVLGGKGTAGKVLATRRIQGSTPQDARRAIEALQVEVAQHANRVAIRTLNQMSKKLRVDYEIALPVGMALDLKSMHGNVRLTNVAGDVRVEALSGNVVAEALTRVRLLRSMSGDVTLLRSVIQGDANLQTVSGTVLADGVKASSLTLGSVSGDVHVRDSPSPRAVVRTVSGDIEFATAPLKAGRYELKTHAGDIMVLTPAGVGFEFEASTFRGDVTAPVPTPAQAGTRQVRGTIGDGSAFFDLTTFAGNIKVVKK